MNYVLALKHQGGWLWGNGYRTTIKRDYIYKVDDAWLTAYVTGHEPEWMRFRVLTNVEYLCMMKTHKVRRLSL